MRLFLVGRPLSTTENRAGSTGHGLGAGAAAPDDAAAHVGRPAAQGGAGGGWRRRSGLSTGGSDDDVRPEKVSWLLEAILPLTDAAPAVRWDGDMRWRTCRWPPSIRLPLMRGQRGGMGGQSGGIPDDDDAGEEGGWPRGATELDRVMSGCSPDSVKVTSVVLVR